MEIRCWPELVVVGTGGAREAKRDVGSSRGFSMMVDERMELVRYA